MKKVRKVPARALVLICRVIAAREAAKKPEPRK